MVPSGTSCRSNACRARSEVPNAVALRNIPDPIGTMNALCLTVNVFKKALSITSTVVSSECKDRWEVWKETGYAVESEDPGP